MGQLDREDKNWLTHPEQDDRPVFIDNDISFPNVAHDLHSSFIKQWEGKPLSESILDSVYLLMGNRGLWDDLQEALDDAKAVRLAKDRAEQVYQQKTIPSPLKVDAEEKSDVNKPASSTDTAE
jgi:hypothetical protein